MTFLVHVVGPQGSGKSTLIRRMVEAAPGRALVHLEAELALGLSNAQVRRAYPQASHVFVEADAPDARHEDLSPGDRLLQVDEQLHRDWDGVWPGVIGMDSGPADAGARDAA